MNTKLPKQWKHWCQKAGLKFYGKQRLSREWDCMEMSSKHGMYMVRSGMLHYTPFTSDFDKWGNAEKVYSLPVPTSLRDMLYFVNSLYVQGRYQHGN